MSESRVVIETLQAGLAEGGSAKNRFTQSNSTGCRITSETTFGVGVANATTFVTPVSARYMVVVMPTTNQSGWRLTATTAEVGLPMSSRGASLVCLPETTAGSTYCGYSTSTRAISGVRLLYL